MKMLTLKNGTEEGEVTVVSTMVTLRMLFKDSPIAFYELVQLARDPEHKLFGNIGYLADLNLIQLGHADTYSIHSSIRNVILSAVEGEKLEMRIVNPAIVTLLGSYREGPESPERGKG